MEAKRTCIVVDDTCDDRDFLTSELQEEGYKVIAFSKGSEVLDYLKSHTSDFIVSDQRMPEMLGSELFVVLREKGVAIPFLLCTGEINAREIQAQYKIDGLLEKPFNKSQLIKAIENIINPNKKASVG